MGDETVYGGLVAVPSKSPVLSKYWTLVTVAGLVADAAAVNVMVAGDVRLVLAVGVTIDMVGGGNTVTLIGLLVE